MKFDLAKAQEAMGKMFQAQMPDKDCKVCKGTGFRKMTLCIGMNRQETETYCDCTVKGFMPRRK